MQNDLHKRINKLYLLPCSPFQMFLNAPFDCELNTCGGWGVLKKEVNMNKKPPLTFSGLGAVNISILIVPQEWGDKESASRFSDPELV